MTETLGKQRLKDPPGRLHAALPGATAQGKIWRTFARGSLESSCWVCNVGLTMTRTRGHLLSLKQMMKQLKLEKRGTNLNYFYFSSPESYSNEKECTFYLFWGKISWERKAEKYLICLLVNFNLYVTSFGINSSESHWNSIVNWPKPI